MAATVWASVGSSSMDVSMKASLVSVLGRPIPALSANDDPVLIGNNNVGTSQTTVRNNSNDAIATLGADSTAPGFPLSAAGVVGTSADVGVFGKGDETGVAGLSEQGHGVEGYATSGVGLRGHAVSGYALVTDARVSFRGVSGVASISAGGRQVTVRPSVDINARSFVLLTPRVNVGSRAIWYTTNASDDSFDIHISSPRSSNTSIAWLLLEKA